MLITLQIIGLRYSAIGYSQRRNLKTQWCSPALQLGSSLVDSTCQTYNITTSNNGTGCIILPGAQPKWLLGTMLVLIIEIVIEIVDAIILIKADERTLWKDIKKKRPWCTMIFGIGVMASFIALGVYQSTYFPLPGNQVAIIGLAEGTCTSTLYYGGLRGSIIAWIDGLFGRFALMYYGPAGP